MQCNHCQDESRCERMGICQAFRLLPRVEPLPAQAETWQMPEAREMLKFINTTPLVQSLLYDLNLLPECITDATRWAYMVTVCEHMRAASPGQQWKCGDVHPNHRADLRYILATLEQVVPVVKKDAALRERVEAAINGMRYVLRRTEETPPPSPTLKDTP